MEPIRRWWLRTPQREYEHIGPNEGDAGDTGFDGDGIQELNKFFETPFSWLEYLIFLWMGVSMLWAWNMFLAAAPYFLDRFESNPWVVSNFQSSILSVSTLTNLTSVFILAKLQENASYPRRIRLSLIFSMIVCLLLALSTVLLRGVSAMGYFVFLLVMVFAASMSTGMIQNGVFAYVAGFGQERYIQAIMAGQGVAGVLPCIVQILSVLLATSPVESSAASPDRVQYQPYRSAFVYFGTAVCVSGIGLLSFIYLDRRHNLRITKAAASRAGLLEQEETDEREIPAKKSIPLHTLFTQLRWASLAMFICFGVTMIYPVFATKIYSVRISDQRFRPAVFIPLAQLIWNIGDLLGRFILLLPHVDLSTYPFVLFIMSIARLGFIPLYMLCNIGGRGAVINSDAFYLVVVQLLFGVTNGYIGASCMVSAAEWVAPEEKEAAGAFMSLMLVAGLTTGSFLSFLIKV
ncbi:hypothetical protein VTO42DRAFT_414 [Malbranchea cinnamomea]